MLEDTEYWKVREIITKEINRLYNTEARRRFTRMGYYVTIKIGGKLEERKEDTKIICEVNINITLKPFNNKNIYSDKFFYPISLGTGVNIRGYIETIYENIWEIILESWIFPNNFKYENKDC